MLVCHTLRQGRESRLWCALVVDALRAGASMADAMAGARVLVVDEAEPLAVLTLITPATPWCIAAERGWVDAAAARVVAAGSRPDATGSSSTVLLSRLA